MAQLTKIEIPDTTTKLYVNHEDSSDNPFVMRLRSVARNKPVIEVFEDGELTQTWKKKSIHSIRWYCDGKFHKGLKGIAKAHGHTI